uniref:Cytochrome P450 n=1 Tax=Stomoxys calcitrans TaxID=35570 RepID=A0A1I8Q344_STOCA
MTYALYELATNPPIQEKVRGEILQIMAKHKRNLTYESLKDMKFLKAVIQETLRKNTIVGFMPRVCRCSCTVRTSCNSPLTIQQGTSVLIPIHGVLHNPDLYADPDTFLPERFLEGEEEANKIDRCSFMAFGIGPKVCIGEPFARLELSLALALLLSEFQFSVCDKTPSKLIFDPKKRFMSTVKNGVHLSVKRLRHKEE